jgi:hypothetical protein
MDNTSSTIISYIVIRNNSKGSVLKLHEEIKQRSVSATRKSNSKIRKAHHKKLSFSNKCLMEKSSRVTINGTDGQKNMSIINYSAV